MPFRPHQRRTSANLEGRLWRLFLAVGLPFLACLYLWVGITGLDDALAASRGQGVPGVFTVESRDWHWHSGWHFSGKFVADDRSVTLEDVTLNSGSTVRHLGDTAPALLEPSGEVFPAGSDDTYGSLSMYILVSSVVLIVWLMWVWRRLIRKGEPTVRTGHLRMRRHGNNTTYTVHNVVTKERFQLTEWADLTDARLLGVAYIKIATRDVHDVYRRVGQPPPHIAQMLKTD